MYEEVTSGFIALTDKTEQSALQESMSALEQFVALIYDRTKICTLVNDARKVLFTKKGISKDAIPLTAAAWVQYTKKVGYQAGYVWGQSTTPTLAVPSPTECVGVVENVRYTVVEHSLDHTPRCFQVLPTAHQVWMQAR